MTFIVKTLSISDRSQWTEFLHAHPHTGFMQSWEWSLFKELEGYQVIRKGVFSNNRLLGGAIAYVYPFPVEPTLMVVPDGPVLDWSSPESGPLFESLSEALREETAPFGVVALRIEPRLNQLPPVLSPLPRAPVDLVPRQTIEIKLSDEKSMLTAMKPKGRYNVRLSRRHGVEVVTSTDPADVHEFYSVFEQTANRQKFSSEPKSFFINLVKSLFPVMARFCFARYQGQTLAVALTIRCGPMVTYLYGGHVEAHPEVMASYALHWHILQEAAQDGLTVYDMYGFIDRGNPQHPYDRFSRFKEKLGGTSVKRIGSRDVLFYDRMADMAIAVFRSMEPFTLIQFEGT